MFSILLLALGGVCVFFSAIISYSFTFDTQNNSPISTTTITQKQKKSTVCMLIAQRYLLACLSEWMNDSNNNSNNNTTQKWCEANESKKNERRSKKQIPKNERSLRTMFKDFCVATREFEHLPFECTYVREHTIVHVLSATLTFQQNKNMCVCVCAEMLLLIYFFVYTRNSSNMFRSPFARQWKEWERERASKTARCREKKKGNIIITICAVDAVAISLLFFFFFLFSSYFVCDVAHCIPHIVRLALCYTIETYSHTHSRWKKNECRYDMRVAATVAVAVATIRLELSQCPQQCCTMYIYTCR